MHAPFNSILQIPDLLETISDSDPRVYIDFQFYLADSCLVCRTQIFALNLLYFQFYLADSVGG